MFLNADLICKEDSVTAVKSAQMHRLTLLIHVCGIVVFIAVRHSYDDERGPITVLPIINVINIWQIGFFQKSHNDQWENLSWIELCYALQWNCHILWHIQYVLCKSLDCLKRTMQHVKYCTGPEVIKLFPC